MLDLTVEKLQPFLTPNPLPTKKATLVTAWAPVLAALLNARFGDRITTGEGGNEAVFVSAAADAIQRRLDKPNRQVASQSVNGASVSYHATLLAWFAESELSQLDALVGASGVRTYRTPAPDEVRFGMVADREPEGSSGF
jgi:hypothetical protein